MKLIKYNDSNLFIELACLSVCPFVSNKRQNGRTDQAQILRGTTGMIKFKKKYLIFENFENPRHFFYKIRKFLFLFCNVYKEKMFINEIEDGREAT